MIGGNKRDLVINIGANTADLERGLKQSESAARQLHASELRLIAAEEKLERLRATGKASAGQLASAQASVVTAQDRVAKSQTNVADATRQVGRAADGTVVPYKRAGDAAEQAGSRTSRAMNGAAGSIASLRSHVGLLAVGGTAAVAAFARASVGAASDLNEQMAATETLFKDSADAVLDFGRTAPTIGLSTRAALEASNAYGDFFLKLGYTSDAAAVFSEDLVRMAADFASFKNLEPEVVLEKLRSGLAGESEPLRQLGVFLTAAKVEAEAMTLGLVGAHDELTEGDKITARYSLIIKEMGDAYGDVTRTADSYANTQRRAAAASENLRASIGQGLLPVLTDLQTLAAEAGDALTTSSEAGGDNWVYQVPVIGYVAGALGRLADETRSTTTATDYLADSQAILADAENHTEEEVRNATAAIAEQEEALARLLQATIAQFDSEMAYTRALLGITDALESYDEALARNRDGKADNDLSASALQQSELGLSQALLAAGDAAVKQAADHAAAAGRVLTESEKYTVFRDELIRLKEQFPQLAGQIDGYVGRLKEVPGEVKTEVRVIGLDENTAKVKNLGVLLDGLAGRTVTPQIKDPLLPPSLRGVGVGVGDGPGRAGGPVRSRVEQLMAGTSRALQVTSTYRTPAQNRAAGGSPTSYHMDRSNPAVDVGGPPASLDMLYRKARALGGWRELLWKVPGHFDHVHFASQGGYISGPGGPTEDRVPALLSNGEYVIRASSVRKYGADMVSALNEGRLRLQGFALGGQVATAGTGGPVRPIAAALVAA